MLSAINSLPVWMKVYWYIQRTTRRMVSLTVYLYICCLSFDRLEWKNNYKNIIQRLPAPVFWQSFLFLKFTLAYLSLHPTAPSSTVGLKATKNLKGGLRRYSTTTNKMSDIFLLFWYIAWHFDFCDLDFLAIKSSNGYLFSYTRFSAKCVTHW